VISVLGFASALALDSSPDSGLGVILRPSDSSSQIVVGRLDERDSEAPARVEACVISRFPFGVTPIDAPRGATTQAGASMCDVTLVFFHRTCITNHAKKPMVM
jgi:hypothetical protein